MSESWPNPLKLEVKSSRSTTHQLSERDLDGINPDGFAAVLITDRWLKGPRWVLCPAQFLRPGGHNDKELAAVAETNQADLCGKLNRIWSNWILDESVWSKLFLQDHMKIKAAIKWCLQHHPPRQNKSKGNLHEGRLADALDRFRSALDKFLSAETGPKQEGFIHQYLLGDALEQLGYELTENPIGVPDIRATLPVGSNAVRNGIRQNVQQWKPQNNSLVQLREQLLKLTDAELEALSGIVN
ncbi:MAG TPA: hypothetical protein VGQ95_03455 [Chthoniobacterales bacterium]|nr:hypothetical protein [Chthoniobacterales bacterium]